MRTAEHLMPASARAVRRVCRTRHRHPGFSGRWLPSTSLHSARCSRSTSRTAHSPANGSRAAAPARAPMRQAAQGYGAYWFGGIVGTLACVAVAVIPVIVAAVVTNSAPASVRVPDFCRAPPPAASGWPGRACGSRRSRPSSGCQSSGRSPSAAGCNPTRSRPDHYAAAAGREGRTPKWRRLSRFGAAAGWASQPGGSSAVSGSAAREPTARTNTR